MKTVNRAAPPYDAVISVRADSNLLLTLLLTLKTEKAAPQGRPYLVQFKLLANSQPAISEKYRIARAGRYVKIKEQMGRVGVSEMALTHSERGCRYAQAGTGYWHQQHWLVPDRG
jgi:hypothetical protein